MLSEVVVYRIVSQLLGDPLVQYVLEISLCVFFRAVLAAEVERWTIGYVVIVFLEYDNGHGQLCPAVADAYKISFFHIVAISSAPSIRCLCYSCKRFFVFCIYLQEKRMGEGCLFQAHAHKHSVDAVDVGEIH